VQHVLTITPTAVYDQDKSSESQEILEQFWNTRYFTYHRSALSTKDIVRLIDGADVRGKPLARRPAADRRDLLNERLSGMSGEEQVTFLQRLVEENLEWALADLDRSQRAQLTNRLLPVVARHFPLEDVGILGAFASFEDP